MAQSHHYGLILAGGRGTRFWPKSRRRSAKQVLPFVGDRSLIQATVDRLAPVIPQERLWILTNEYLRDEIVRQLPEVPANQILSEPVQRNTAPAIGLAARILRSLDPDAVMGVFPSDHIIGNESRYREVLASAFEWAGRKHIVVLGIRPRWAETGYGYIEFPEGAATTSEPVAITRFREKPKPATARKYLAAGRFYWNAGMFFWRADVLLQALRRYLPKTAMILEALPDFPDPQFHSALESAFSLCENISIDYAVLERAQTVMGIACDEIGWNDVGSWNAVYELLPQDENKNVATSGIVSMDSSGNYVDAHRKTVALLGVDNLIVVDTPDALLIADRNRAQQVSEIVKILEQKQRTDLL